MSSPTGGMTPAEFVAKWTRVQLAERAASQEHFIDLVRMLGQPTPAEHDATGAEYAFEKGVAVTGPASKGSKGAYGWADVWWKDKFGWEYKTKDKHETLDEAYRQLCQYHEALGQPPLLIVCDITRIEIHTKFTGTASQIHVIRLEELAETESIVKLRRVFNDPYAFKPKLTLEQITEEVAGDFGKLAISIRDRGHDPQDVAHFLMKCMFCLFAEDVGLLPKEIFSQLLMNFIDHPDRLSLQLDQLFTSMRDGGAFGINRIEYFNGGLFKDGSALPLTRGEIGVMAIAAGRDWSGVEPAIFGTLFERSLDPSKRAQIGAHYTSRDDILLVVEPVVMAPLRGEWEQVQAKINAHLAKRRALDADKSIDKKKARDGIRNANNAISKLLTEFDGRLSTLRILDPACGSGNFLYVAIQQLLNLEKEVITCASRPEIGMGLIPRVRPTQLHGIEINPYAAELAQVVIWIGYLQWMRDNGFNAPRDPILEAIQTIENRDAILDLSDPAHPAPGKWPQADFIIGNPPFLGAKMLRASLGDSYVISLYKVYERRVGGISDLCCYWFDLAGISLSHSPRLRVGLLATQAIRNGIPRKVLENICKHGAIFHAWSDREWVLDGAAVHISIVCFDNGSETKVLLDGEPCLAIHPNLTGGVEVGLATQLPENGDVGFLGVQFSGPFDMGGDEARTMVRQPANVSGCRNIDVVKPVFNAIDLTRRFRDIWAVDFGIDTPMSAAAQYEKPFKFVETHVKPMRAESRSALRDDRWWLPLWTRTEMRRQTAGLHRFLATPAVSKFRLFAWMNRGELANHAVVVFGRSDDYFFGVVHSAVHEHWARSLGTQLREVESGFRYTPTTCFETFALPWPPGKEPAEHPAYHRISDAARELNEQRERWLNPPEWIDPIARQVDAEDAFADVPPQARPLIRQSAIMARAAKDPRLKKRTLTNLYNERPTWLKLAHEKLDRAVLAAYAAVDPAGSWPEDLAEVWKETGAGQPLPASDPLAAKRAEVDQAVLANLLRMNHERASKA